MTAAQRVAAALEAIASDQHNIFTLVQDDEALTRAEAGGVPGLLSGITVAVKDLIDQAGVLNTAGSSFLRRVPDESAPAVDRLVGAGAIILGRVGLHEFAFGFSSENHWFGPVRNPWDPDTSPGGSSGGSAAAVCAGLVDLALGTDTGGSVRVPAALCGVVGLKVTHGRIPISGVVPLAPSVDTVGPLARDVATAAAGYRAMSGHSPSDPWSRSGNPQGPSWSLEGLRVGIPQPWVEAAPMDPAVSKGFEWATSALKDAGASVEQLSLEYLDPRHVRHESVLGEIASVHRSWWSDPSKEYGPEVHARLASAMEVSLDECLKAAQWRRELRDRFAAVFEGVDVLATPTVPAMRKTIGVDTISIGGEGVHYRTVLSWFTALVNYTSAPAISLPLSLPGRPPPSIQLIGPRWSEDGLLALGASLERRGIVACRSPYTQAP